MLQMIAHFGDDRDPGTPCGQCDVCAPESCIALAHREPSASEKLIASRIVSSLSTRDEITVGQLHRDLFPAGEVDRRTVEHVIGGLVRAHAISLVEDSFEKEGSVITFQRVYLSGGSTGQKGAASDFVPAFRMTAKAPAGSGARRRTRGIGLRPIDRQSNVRSAHRVAAQDEDSAAELFEALRAWRLAEARRAGLPAFRVLTDATLMAIASETPIDENALLLVRGIGPALARRYGEAVLGIVARYPAR